MNQYKVCIHFQLDLVFKFRVMFPQTSFSVLTETDYPFFRAEVTLLGAGLCLCLEEDSFSGLDLTRDDLTR